MKNVIIWTEKY